MTVKVRYDIDHAVKPTTAGADGVTHDTCGGRVGDTGSSGPARDETAGGPDLMDTFLSWARSTVANVEHTLGRSDRYFDRILVGVIVGLAVAIALLFLQGA